MTVIVVRTDRPACVCVSLHRNIVGRAKGSGKINDNPSNPSTPQKPNRGITKPSMLADLGELAVVMLTLAELCLPLHSSGTLLCAQKPFVQYETKSTVIRLEAKCQLTGVINFSGVWLKRTWHRI